MLRCSHTVTVLIIHGLIVAQQCSTGWYRGLWFRWTFYNYCTHWGTVSSVCNLHNFTCHTSRIREVFREHIQNYRAEVVLNQGHKQELFQLGGGLTTAISWPVRVQPRVVKIYFVGRRPWSFPVIACLLPYVHNVHMNICLKHFHEKNI